MRDGLYAGGNVFSQATCAHRSAMSSVVTVLSQFSLHCEMELVYRVACLFTTQLSPIFTAPTHGRMARLS